MNSALDLTHLESMLRLPCYIGNGRILTDTPILARANRVDEYVFGQTVLSGESLSDFLYRIYDGANQYDMDCSVYAQLVSLVLSNQWPSNGGEIIICICYGIGDMMLWGEKISQMGYLSVSNTEAAQFLAGLPTSAKGEWLIQIDTNKFLGLSSNTGPCVLTMEQWVSQIRTALEDYASSVNTDLCACNSGFSQELFVTNARKSILNCHFKLNHIDKWGFCFSKGYASVKALWTSEGVTIKHRSLPQSDLRLENSSTDLYRDHGSFPRDFESLYPFIRIPLFTARALSVSGTLF